MQINPLDFQLLKILTLEKASRLLSLPKTDFWATVKSLMHGDVLLNLDGKEILVKNGAQLKVGEKVLLRPKIQGESLELEILQRVWEKNSSLRPLSRLNGSLDEVLTQYANKEGAMPETLLSLLRTLFPVMDWKEDTPYFHWKWEEGEAQGYLGEKGEDKLFFLRIQRQIAGKMEAIFSWKDETAAKMGIEMRFWNPKMYFGMLLKEKEMRLGLEGVGIRVENLALRQMTVSSAQGWKA